MRGLSSGGFRGESSEQRREIARGDDLRILVTHEGKQPALVACHQIIRLARFGQGQQKIIGRIGRAFDARQRIDDLGKLFELVDEAASLIGLNALRNRRLVQRGAQIRSVKYPSCQAR